MQYEDFKRQLARAGLNVTEFAALLGRSPESVMNYGQRGTVPDHIALAAVLMAELADAGRDFRPAVLRLGISRKRARGRGFGS